MGRSGSSSSPSCDVTSGSSGSHLGPNRPLTSGWRKPKPHSGPGGEGHGRLTRTRGLEKTLGLAWFSPGAGLSSLFPSYLQTPHPTWNVQLSRQSTGGRRECDGKVRIPRTNFHTWSLDTPCVVPPVPVMQAVLQIARCQRLLD